MPNEFENVINELKNSAILSLDAYQNSIRVGINLETAKQDFSNSLNESINRFNVQIGDILKNISNNMMISNNLISDINKKISDIDTEISNSNAKIVETNILIKTNTNDILKINSDLKIVANLNLNTDFLNLKNNVQNINNTFNDLSLYFNQLYGPINSNFDGELEANKFYTINGNASGDFQTSIVKINNKWLFFKNTKLGYAKSVYDPIKVNSIESNLSYENIIYMPFNQINGPNIYLTSQAYNSINSNSSILKLFSIVSINDFSNSNKFNIFSLDKLNDSYFILNSKNYLMGPDTNVSDTFIYESNIGDNIILVLLKENISNILIINNSRYGSRKVSDKWYITTNNKIVYNLEIQPIKIMFNVVDVNGNEFTRTYFFTLKKPIVSISDILTQNNIKPTSFTGVIITDWYNTVQTRPLVWSDFKPFSDQTINDKCQIFILLSKIATFITDDKFYYKATDETLVKLFATQIDKTIKSLQMALTLSDYNNFIIEARKLSDISKNMSPKYLDTALIETTSEFVLNLTTFFNRISLFFSEPVGFSAQQATSKLSYFVSDIVAISTAGRVLQQNSIVALYPYTDIKIISNYNKLTLTPLTMSKTQMESNSLVYTGILYFDDEMENKDLIFTLSGSSGSTRFTTGTITLINILNKTLFNLNMNCTGQLYVNDNHTLGIKIETKYNKIFYGSFSIKVVD
jgi:hypothetical protein